MYVLGGRLSTTQRDGVASHGDVLLAFLCDARGHVAVCGTVDMDSRDT